MDRITQFNNVEGISTWYDDIMNRYEAAFWVHYRILNSNISAWVVAVNDEDIMPRVEYYINTEYMSVVFSELLLSLELLFKAELVRTGAVSPIRTHSLNELLEMMEDKQDDRCNKILDTFNDYRELFIQFDQEKVFVNVRYLEYYLDESSATLIKDMVILLDELYSKLYSDFDIERLLYLSMDVSMGGSELSEDEIRRLKNAGIDI